MIKHRLIIIIIIGTLVAISIPRLLIALENFESAARPNTDVSQYSPLFMLQLNTQVLTMVVIHSIDAY
jgi:hypothetical protein